MTRVLPADPARNGRGLTGPPVEAKLGLLEFLLGSEDPQACAQRALEWLGAYAGVKQAICAHVDPATERLVAAAGFGVPAARIEQFSVDLEARDHPLVMALSAAHPLAITISPATPSTRSAIGSRRNCARCHIRSYLKRRACSSGWPSCSGTGWSVCAGINSLRATGPGSTASSTRCPIR